MNLFFLCNNSNQNEYEIVLILILKQIHIFFLSKSSQQPFVIEKKFLPSFQVTCKSMFVEVIPK